MHCGGDGVTFYMRILGSGRLTGCVPVGWQITDKISVGVTPDVESIRTEPDEPIQTLHPRNIYSRVECFIIGIV